MKTAPLTREMLNAEGRVLALEKPGWSREFYGGIREGDMVYYSSYGLFTMFPTYMPVSKAIEEYFALVPDAPDAPTAPTAHQVASAILDAIAGETHSAVNPKDQFVADRIADHNYAVKDCLTAAVAAARKLGLDVKVPE